MKRTNDQLSTDDLIGFAPFKKNLDPISSGRNGRIIREISSGGEEEGGGRERESKDTSVGNLNVIPIHWN